MKESLKRFTLCAQRGATYSAEVNTRARVGVRSVVKSESQ